MQTIGQNILTYRKEKGLTQEALAEICSVTPQAVSKWENDVSYPDITLLKPIARAFGISVDELLDDGQGPVTRLEKECDFSQKLLRIRVGGGKDKVNVNLPMGILSVLSENETLMAKLGGNSGWTKSVDLKQILALVSMGVVGKLVEIESEDGEKVEVWVE